MFLTGGEAFDPYPQGWDGLALIDNNGGRFAIDSATGVVTVADTEYFVHRLRQRSRIIILGEKGLLPDPSAPASRRGRLWIENGRRDGIDGDASCPRLGARGHRRWGGFFLRRSFGRVAPL